MNGELSVLIQRTARSVGVVHIAMYCEWLAFCVDIRNCKKSRCSARVWGRVSLVEEQGITRNVGVAAPIL